MKKLFFLLFLLAFLNFKATSREKFWQLGLYSFFDNIEFGQSAFKIPQTLAGVIISPSIHVQWDSVHNIIGGVNFLKEFGSKNYIDDFFLTAYYHYDKQYFRFMMGAFPRKFALEHYPRIFFQDSLAYYRPNINGVLWEFNYKNFHANSWLDWTGRQDYDVNEAFLLGLSGRFNKAILYFQYFSYLNHFAAKKDPVVSESLHDNAQVLVSAGIDLSGKTIFDVLDFNAGWTLGVDRSRSEHSGWINQHGFISEQRLEYHGLGLFNSLYIGEGQMHFYYKHANKLYWGDPIYQAKKYNRSDLYLSFLRKKNIDAKVIYSLHFAEGRIYHEQIIRLSLNVEW